MENNTSKEGPKCDLIMVGCCGEGVYRGVGKEMD